MRKILIAFLILNLFLQKAISQNKPEIEWEKTYGGYSREDFSMILPTTGNGYILAGSTVSNDGDIKSGNAGWDDFWVISINQNGEIIWEKTYGDIKDEVLTVIQQAPDGGFLLGGFTNTFTEEQIMQKRLYDFVIYKIDNKGSTIWKKTFGGNGDDILQAIQPTPDGGFLLGGRTCSVDGDVQSRNGLTYDYFERDMWVIKIDKNGVLQWEKTYGKNYSAEILNCFFPLNDGYLLGGSSTRNKNGDTPQGVNGPSYFCLIKIDFNGNVIWEKRYGGSGNENMAKILKTNDGGYLLAGSTSSVDGDIHTRTRIDYYYYWDIDYWVVKVDNSGNLEWEKSYGNIGWDNLNSCCSTSNGGYMLVGVSDSDVSDINSENPAQFDCWVINIDSVGNIIWDAKYGGSNDDSFNAIIPTKDGEYLFGGTTKSNDGDIKSGNHGAQNPWTHGRMDIWVMKSNSKLSSTNKIITDNTNFYPNPVSDKLQINFNEEGVVSVFDFFGKLLLQQSITKYNNVINVSSIPSGTYILNFNSKEHFESSKFIKM